MGITRAADITGLDRLGIPTWCAVRPGALQTQISNGKGLTHAAAKASALMEAIEHFHAETIAVETVRASHDEMRRRGMTCVPARSEEHTSELQSLMRISYAVFCLKKKHQTQHH